MPKMEMDGLEEFGFAMNEILAKSESILKRSVYDGAHVVFEEVKHKIGESWVGQNILHPIYDPIRDAVNGKK